ncbi:MULTISPECIES: endonuclease [unclassified Leeuwenhoekiella]|mgnify:CR=1 FL=1|uniref:endonuclease n=1 Tax=unclassified Leeuwenhoekiella TaxID=2615029 RepID=UPI000C38CAF3|nr:MULTISPECIES: endonuclease [unclassified Leeuwenhoekiella]MAW95802.1 endonuclease I [Leeuwenhoekiella sp.]MBA82927.1 endonuclease I [Leeuwenhoekiella sp.]|tara:strand:- start:18990 stop:20348 length:1359 start_codon:yes stop_codon:yes gene_type:complete
MKLNFKYVFGFLTLFLMACSESEDPIVETEPEIELEEPVAVDDEFSGVENQDLILDDLIGNDDLADGARITSVTSTTTQGGAITDNRNGSYTYVAPENFVGQDNFTYELCLNADTNICSTGNVLITIEDAGTAVANDDEVGTGKNRSLVIDDLLENDDLVDGAIIASVDASASTGQAVLNTDGTVTYTPTSDFVGQDSFTYTLCDNDTPATCVTATVTVNVIEALSFNIPSELVSYYSTASFFEDEDLTFDALSNLTQNKHTTILTYFQRHEYLYDADEDPSNPANVILMYTGESRDRREYTSGSNPHSPQTFNTEHIFPQSLLSTEDAVTDLHHLRSADDAINSLRLNYPFVDGSGIYKLVNNNSWYPGDEWKGDVARMVLYLNIRYGEDFNKVGNLDLFLKWNREDPVSEFEIQRNNVIQGAQGNRNPFIDNPYLITLIWGGTPAENTWE